MADKAKKKTVKVLDNFSDSDASLPELECEICGVSYTDPKAYENHILGKKHSKKVTELKLKAKIEKSDKEDESESEDSEDDMHCDECDKSFTGYVSYAAHIKGTLHAKNVKKQKLKKQLDDMPEVLKKDNEEDDSEDDGILPKPYARCTSCQKEFGGPESFKMHVKSATHLKKVKQAKTMADLKKNEGEHSDGEEIYSKCQVCKKSFSGVVPYKIHMQSNVHKKNLEKQKIAEEIKEFCSNTDFSEGYICKECKKTFTDPLGFKCHLHNNSHEKQKAKNALAEFLNAYPEIVYVTPYDKSESGEESGAEESELYYLICKLCHVSFSGPESAQDHVKSKKHITTKKEKKIKMLLKEKQKNSSESPDDKTSNKQTVKEATAEDKHSTASKNGHDNSVDEFELL